MLQVESVDKETQVGAPTIHSVHIYISPCGSQEIDEIV